MVVDGVAAVVFDAGDQFIQVVTAEIFGFAAVVADEQVLVSAGRGDVAMTAGRVMHALNQPQ